MIEDEFPAKEKRDKVSLIVVAFHKRNHYDNNQSNIIHTLDSHHHHLVHIMRPRSKNHYVELVVVVLFVLDNGGSLLVY